LHANDELYSLLRGPAENMEILATSFSPTRLPRPAEGTTPAPAAGAAPARTVRTTPAPAAGTTAVTARRNFRREGRDEPVLMTISYGKGRIFHTTLGHADEGGGPAMQCAGFIITLQRGAEWAVTGNVTQKIPWDFPSAAGVVLRPDFKAMTLDEAFANIGKYEITKSTRYLTCIQSHIRDLAGDEKGLLELEKKMVKVLTGKETTVDAKKLLLHELGWMGSDYSVAAIKGLVSDAELKDEAEFALSRLKK
jgi:hypothetical protein